jgi:hypothetical protein
VPSHCYRMRVFDRDLIRGGHYGQRSCEPHLKAEHMAAPTNAANVKKALANSEPSTHGTSRRFAAVRQYGRVGGEADMPRTSLNASSVGCSPLVGPPHAVASPFTARNS